MDFALNNQQKVICHKTQATNQPYTFKFAQGLFRIFLISANKKS